MISDSAPVIVFDDHGNIDESADLVHRLGIPWFVLSFIHAIAPVVAWLALESSSVSRSARKQWCAID